uniref:long-chain-fatty-acid--CoA ligase n=1 Tax=Dermatophagoides pteronyssinus TaxID=6956 RepID=A0A6P6XK99_DERPT|nr:protein PF14_0175-like [Dermatophagoides pteronyssinus]
MSNFLTGVADWIINKFSSYKVTKKTSAVFKFSSDTKVQKINKNKRLSEIAKRNFSNLHSNRRNIQSHINVGKYSKDKLLNDGLVSWLPLRLKNSDDEDYVFLTNKGLPIKAIADNNEDSTSFLKHSSLGVEKLTKVTLKLNNVAYGPQSKEENIPEEKLDTKKSDSESYPSTKLNCDCCSCLKKFTFGAGYTDSVKLTHLIICNKALQDKNNLEKQEVSIAREDLNDIKNAFTSKLNLASLTDSTQTSDISLKKLNLHNDKTNAVSIDEPPKNDNHLLGEVDNKLDFSNLIYDPLSQKKSSEKIVSSSDPEKIQTTNKTDDTCTKKIEILSSNSFGLDTSLKQNKLNSAIEQPNTFNITIDSNLKQKDSLISNSFSHDTLSGQIKSSLGDGNSQAVNKTADKDKIEQLDVSFDSFDHNKLLEKNKLNLSSEKFQTINEAADKDKKQNLELSFTSFNCKKSAEQNIFELDNDSSKPINDTTDKDEKNKLDFSFDSFDHNKFMEQYKSKLGTEKSQQTSQTAKHDTKLKDNLEFGLLGQNLTSNIGMTWNNDKSFEGNPALKFSFPDIGKLNFGDTTGEFKKYMPSTIYNNDTLKITNFNNSKHETDVVHDSLETEKVYSTASDFNNNAGGHNGFHKFQSSFNELNTLDVLNNNSFSINNNIAANSLTNTAINSSDQNENNKNNENASYLPPKPSESLISPIIPSMFNEPLGIDFQSNAFGINLTKPQLANKSHPKTNRSADHEYDCAEKLLQTAYSTKEDDIDLSKVYSSALFNTKPDFENTIESRSFTQNSENDQINKSAELKQDYLTQFASGFPKMNFATSDVPSILSTTVNTMFSNELSSNLNSFGTKLELNEASQKLFSGNRSSLNQKSGNFPELSLGKNKLDFFPSNATQNNDLEKTQNEESTDIDFTSVSQTDKTSQNCFNDNTGSVNNETTKKKPIMIKRIELASAIKIRNCEDIKIKEPSFIEDNSNSSVDKTLTDLSGSGNGSIPNHKSESNNEYDNEKQIKASNDFNIPKKDEIDDEKDETNVDIKFGSDELASPENSTILNSLAPIPEKSNVESIKSDDVQNTRTTIQNRGKSNYVSSSDERRPLCVNPKTAIHVLNDDKRSAHKRALMYETKKPSEYSSGFFKSVKGEQGNDSQCENVPSEYCSDSEPRRKRSLSNDRVDFEARYESILSGSCSDRNDFEKATLLRKNIKDILKFESAVKKAKKKIEFDSESPLLKTKKNNEEEFKTIWSQDEKNDTNSDEKFDTVLTQNDSNIEEQEQSSPKTSVSAFENVQTPLSNASGTPITKTLREVASDVDVYQANRDLALSNITFGNSPNDYNDFNFVPNEKAAMEVFNLNNIQPLGSLDQNLYDNNAEIPMHKMKRRANPVPHSQPEMPINYNNFSQTEIDQTKSEPLLQPTLFSKFANDKSYFTPPKKTSDGSETCAFRSPNAVSGFITTYSGFEAKNSWDVFCHTHEPLLDFTPPAPEAVGTISFTSGTTGDPKGVLLTESAFAAQVLAVHIYQNSVNTFYLIPDFCYFSYLPLSHIFERIMLLICISFGMRIALVSGKVDRLASDTQIAKPHLLCVVPRLLSTLYNKVEGMVETKGWVSKKLFYKALDIKIKRFRETGAFEHFLWDKIVFKKIRDVLGGQLKYMLSGGALLERDLQEKIACLFSIPVMQGYGSTETFGTTFCSISKDNNYGQVGGPLSVTEVKLVSVPDLEIQVNDEIMKGEAYIRGPPLFVGYFRNPKATKEAIKDDLYCKLILLIVRI